MMENKLKKQFIFSLLQLNQGWSKAFVENVILPFILLITLGKLFTHGLLEIQYR